MNFMLRFLLNLSIAPLPAEKLIELYAAFLTEFAFFEYLSPFCFLSIEFHCAFSISYKILPYFVYYYCILVRM